MERETEIETDGRTDKEGSRQVVRDRETYRRADRHTKKQAGREKGGQAGPDLLLLRLVVERQFSSS